jgi:hypothetical protein
VREWDGLDAVDETDNDTCWERCLETGTDAFLSLDDDDDEKEE